jgi:RNA polymerase sigma-70 factor (ECF subfamily)
VTAAPSAPSVDDATWGRLVTAYPKVALTREAFASHLARSDAPPASFDDLFLACAASHGDAAAIAELEAMHLPALRRVLVGSGPRSIDADDLVQGLRERLFSAVAGAPKVAEYSGRAPLGAWLRVVAARFAVSAGRKRGELPTAEALDQLPAEGKGADPELAYLRAKYKDVFQAAFRDAARTLAPEDRNVLRYYYSEGLTIDQIGSIYRLHRVTASRRVRRARATLLEATRAELMRSHFESASELHSVLRAVESEVALSLHTLFTAES